MRLAADGTVLAANDAALSLFGVDSVAQALGMSFANWVPSDQRDRWNAFSASVIQRGPASIECEIRAPFGDPHPTLFHAVPLVDHPDGIASMAVAARGLSGQRQLERALVELEDQLIERDANRMKAVARLSEVEESRRQLAETVASLETRLRARDAEADTDRRRIADLEARAEALADANAARQKAEANCARARADVQQLEMALEAFAARQQPPSDAGQDPERGRLAARLEEREAALRHLETAHEKLAADHAATIARHTALLRALREHAARLGALASDFPDGAPDTRPAEGPAAADAGREEREA